MVNIKIEKSLIHFSLVPSKSKLPCNSCSSGRYLAFPLAILCIHFFCFFFEGEIVCTSLLLLLLLSTSYIVVTVSLSLRFEVVSSLLLLVKDSKIRVVVFGCSLRFFNFSIIFGFTSHSSSSSFCILGIRAFYFACELVACLITTRDDTIVGVVAYGRDAMVGITFSLSAICFAIHDVAMVSLRVWSNRFCRCHLDVGMVDRGVSNWSVVDLFFAITCL